MAGDKKKARKEGRTLVFIDESGTSTKMARRYGRAPRGERCRAAVPHGHWKTTTFVGALRLEGMTAPMTLDGAMNSRELSGGNRHQSKGGSHGKRKGLSIQHGLGR